MSLDDANPFKKLDKSLFPDEEGKSPARPAGAGAGKNGAIVRRDQGRQGAYVKGSAVAANRAVHGGKSDADDAADTDFLRAMAGVARMDSRGATHAGQAGYAKSAGKSSKGTAAERSGGHAKVSSAAADEDGLVSMAELEAFKQVVDKDTVRKRAISREQAKGLFTGDSLGTSRPAAGSADRTERSSGQTTVPPRQGVDRTSTRISDDVRKRTRVPVPRIGVSDVAAMMEKPEPDAEDGDAFLQAMQGVEGITARGRDIRVQPELSRPQPVPHSAQALQDLLDGTIDFQLEFSEEYIQGHVSGFDPMEMGRMRSGFYSPEAHLDLHGMVAQQAYEALIFFMRTAYHKGLRTVLLIPGRGLNSPDGYGVLREKLQQWLTREPFKRVVLAFCTALPRDGGAGAIYVMLRKFKKSRGKIQWERTPSDPDLFI